MILPRPALRLSGFSWALLTLIACVVAPMATAADAGRNDLVLTARLVWGTDESKPEKPGLVDVDPRLRSKLQNVFKWRNYFECHRETIAIPASSHKRATMSDQCEVEVENLGASFVEVRLYGQHKLLVKKRQALTPGEYLLFAGDDGKSNAWFVALSLGDK